MEPESPSTTELYFQWLAAQDAPARPIRAAFAPMLRTPRDFANARIEGMREQSNNRDLDVKPPRG